MAPLPETGRDPRRASRRILVVRRDNIGDLVATTPLLHALRLRYPDAYVAVLASSYNVDVLIGNPDIDAVFVFLKRQQKSHGHGLAAMLWARWKLVRRLRALRFDDIVLANGGWRYARQLGGRRLIGFRERDNPPQRQPQVIVPLADARGTHEVRKMAALGAALDVAEGDALGPLRLFADPPLLAACQAALAAAGWDAARPTLAVHISSRRPQQRWPEEAFVDFMRRLHVAEPEWQLLLLWSPGAEDDPMHPGDDGKAARIAAACAGLPLYMAPTQRVAELVAALACCRRFVGSDGGAMHLAAGLGLPMVCFFGDSSVAEWHPWGISHELLQPPEQRVDAISVDTALAAWRRL